jgi:hypothetical protein
MIEGSIKSRRKRHAELLPAGRHGVSPKESFGQDLMINGEWDTETSSA